MTNERSSDFRDEVEDLLPWYAAGTLDAEDAARVDAALATDAELRRRLAIVREELGETVHVNQSIGAPSARALDALLARIDAEPRRAKPLSTQALDLGAKVARLFQPRTLAWAGIAAAAVIAVQAVMLIDAGGQRQGPGYRTASENGSVAAGTVLLVSFAPEASAAVITALLQANQATLIDGPMPGGMFKIRVKAETKEDVERTLAALRANTNVVRFVAIGR